MLDLIKNAELTRGCRGGSAGSDTADIGTARTGGDSCCILPTVTNSTADDTIE